MKKLRENEFTNISGKRNGWMEYGSPNHFSPCPRPDHQGCLDQFEIDGNIQFKP